MGQLFQKSGNAVFMSIRISWTSIGGPPDTGTDVPLDVAITAKISNLVSGCGGTVVAKSEDDLICSQVSFEAAIATVRVINQQCAAEGVGDHIALRMGIHVNDGAPSSEVEWAYCVACARQLARIVSSGQTLVCTSSEDDTRPFEDFIDPVDLAEYTEDRPFPGARFFLVNWQDDVATSMVYYPSRESPVTRIKRLRLRWRHQQVIIDQDSDVILLGRGASMDISVESPFASRRHASLRYENACFILSDTSSNGTFVNLDDSVVYIHDDDIILRGQGWISLGRRPSKSLGKVVYFSSETHSS